MDSDQSKLDEESLRVKFEVLSTENDLKQFMESPLWRDFSKLLENRLEVIQKEMTTVETMEGLKDLQGEYRGVEFWRVLPGMIRSRYEMQKELDSKKEQNNG